MFISFSKNYSSLGRVTCIINCRKMLDYNAQRKLCYSRRKVESRILRFGVKRRFRREGKLGNCYPRGRGIFSINFYYFCSTFNLPSIIYMIREFIGSKYLEKHGYWSRWSGQPSCCFLAFRKSLRLGPFAFSSFSFNSRRKVFDSSSNSSDDELIFCSSCPSP